MRWRRLPDAAPAPAPPGPRVRRSESVAFFVPVSPRCEINVQSVPGGAVVSVTSVEKTAAAANAGLRNILTVLAHYTREALGELE